MRKILAALLALAMVLALVPAVMAENAPITVTVFKGDPGDQPTADNKIYKKIADELGITFEIEFLANDLNQTLALKIADDKQPDLFDGGNSAEQLEDADVLIDLLPYISEEKTPNLYKHLHSTNVKLDQLLSKDGKLYIIPNYGVLYNDNIKTYNGPSFFAQKKVIEWNNYVVPKTVDEYFAMLEGYLAEHPTAEDGTPYTGFAILCEDWRRFCLINPVQHLMGRPNDGEVLVDVNDPEFATWTFIDQDYAKPYYAKLNEVYHKGLISADTFVMNYDQYIAALSSGYVLGMFDQAWDFGTATQSLQTAEKYAETFLPIPLLYDEDDLEGIALPSENWKIEEHYINGDVINRDRGFGIAATAEDPERLVQLLDTLLSDEWQILLQWGIEGEDYFIDENGRMNMTLEQYKNLSDSEWKRANKAEAIFTSAPKKQGTQDNGNAWDPTLQPEIRTANEPQYDKDLYAKLGIKAIEELFNPAIELAPYGEAWQINKEPIDIDYQKWLSIQMEWLPKIIMCDPSEIDANFKAFQEEIAPYSKIYADFMHEEILKQVYPERYQ